MATAEEFFDPFASTSSGIKGSPDAPLEFAPAPGYLAVQGQGTIAVKSTAQKLLRFEVRTKLQGSPTLVLDIGAKEYHISYVDKVLGTTVDLTDQAHVIKSTEECWLDPLDIHPHPTSVEPVYWLSVDRNNGNIRYGKYFTNKSMMLLELVLKKKSGGEGKDEKEIELVWINPDRDSWLEKLAAVTITADDSEVPWDQVNLAAVPVVVDLSAFVVPVDDITLKDLELGHKTVPGNLPQACQLLYDNVTGKRILLNESDYQHFTDAIQYSVSTEGCWGFEKLKNKATEFGKSNIKQTYLRITMGVNQGNSPGIPYVLEIWPSGHYSPVHDHGDACAVIRVLHGEIHATYYNSLNSPHAIGTAKLVKDDVTWLGEQNYQIHKLHNLSQDVACTIQCYNYAASENQHQDVFNYTDDTGAVKPWPPTTDCSFLRFREIVMAEWNARKPQGDDFKPPI